METTFRKGNPLMVDHTPGAAVAAGEVVVIGTGAFIAHRPLEANKLGQVAAGGGVYRGTPDLAIGGGVKVYWDDTNNQVTETAGGNAPLGTTVPGGSNGTTSVDVIHHLN